MSSASSPADGSSDGSCSCASRHFSSKASTCGWSLRVRWSASCRMSGASCSDRRLAAKSSGSRPGACFSARRRLAVASSSCFIMFCCSSNRSMPSAWASLSLLMSMRHPVRRAASRAFCPDLPMAKLNWSSAATTVAVGCSPSSCRMTPVALAGLMALTMNVCGSSLHSTTSMRSPANSLTMFLMRLPFMPTQAPTASMCSIVAMTATLLRAPGSRTMFLISMVPSRSSGISCSRSRRNRLRCVRLSLT